MKDLLKAIDNLPWIVKVILALPGLDIVWAIYRIVKGLDTGHTLTLIMGIVWIFVGPCLTWVLDLVWTILGKPLLFAD